jgi:HlyD family secretion protein
MAPGGAGEQGADGGGGRRGGFGGGAGGPGGGMSAEDRTKMREAMQKATGGKSMQDLSPEERQKAMAAVAKAVPALAARMQAAGGGRGGFGGAPGGNGQFSQADLDNAKLPAAAGPDSQLDVLLRPGLLADVEIILEKIPDALNIPNQAVFERDGKQIVYVRNAKGWEERIIQPVKRSESVMVIAGGVKPGDVIAMADPFAKPGDKKKKDKPAGGAAGSLPGGGRS